MGRYCCCETGGKVQIYCGEHSTAQSSRLADIEKETWETLQQGYMVSGSLPGQILKMLVAVSGAKRIVEVGSYTGYSAVAMAEGLMEQSSDEASKLVCIDNFSDEAEAEKLFDKSVGGVNSVQKGLIEPLKLSGREGLKLLKERRECFDMAFVDADKVSQIEYFETLFNEDLLRVGGLLVIDNTLWSSRVLADKGDMDDCTRSISDFNDHVVADGRCQVVQLPVRDGITIVRRLR